MSVEQTYARHVCELQQRYELLMADLALDAVLLFSGTPVRRFLDDSDYPFVANPHFKAWLPLGRHPHCALLIQPGSQPVLFYHNSTDFWHLPTGTPSGFWTPCFDIVEIASVDQIGDQLPRLEQFAFVGENALLAQQWGIVQINPAALMGQLNWHRSIKTEYEITCLREANDKAVIGHVAAKRAFFTGASEFEIQQAYLGATGQRETELPYGNILALNQHGAVLHYQHQELRAPAKSRSFLIDAGAEVRGYAADITRTYAAEEGLFAELIEALTRLQLELVEGLKPGLSFVDLHLQAHLQIAQLLRDVGLVDMSPEAQLEQGVSRVFFPHGLGHLLGIQVHDVAGLVADAKGTSLPAPAQHPFLRLTRTLVPGMVVTVEPGLYFIESLLAQLRAGPHQAVVNWGLLESLVPYGGIRIEDDVVIHAERVENLTRDAFSRCARESG